MTEVNPEFDAVAQVRLLINDPSGPTQTFSAVEINGFLTLEGGDVKLAAAQAIDTIADNEVLLLKVIKDHQLSTDGAKVADSLRKRSAALREQAAVAAEESGAGFFFDVIDLGG